jgi:D-glycero-D-manno-heptose 1,7-bisphosphate phosphatase
LNAVFLDRDGVINRPVMRAGRPYPPASVDELEVFPDVPAALARLKKLGYLLLVVTNQPDVSRGAQQQSVVEDIHLALRSKLPLDDFFTCYHDDGDGCNCRKPAPGLVLDAARRYDVDLSGSFLVGDRWRDIDAGARAGCRTVWIDYGYRERGPSEAPCARVTTFTDAVNWIAEQ